MENFYTFSHILLKDVMYQFVNENSTVLCVKLRKT